jgi:hypothetical protein
MSSYFRSTVEQFLRTPKSELLAALTLRYSEAGFRAMSADTPLTWWADLESLQQALQTVCEQREDAAQWGLLLEFTVPRKLNRLDAVLLAGEQIVLLECKTGLAAGDARRQVETYALLLHYFHAESANRQILPVVVSHANGSEIEGEAQKIALRQAELGFEALPSFWIRPTQFYSWQKLPDFLLNVGTRSPMQLDVVTWDAAPYRPTPTIIEAACDLRTGLSIREIAMSEATEHEISSVSQEILRIIELARNGQQHAICFLTGVPGSGKTLVGLSLAHLSDPNANALHFMSGNGPLVSVLQEVFRRQAMRDGVPSAAAKVQAQTLIENVHVFAKNYTESDRNRAPSNHVIIFDEAQRAWNLEQNLNKFKRNHSEPEMLLAIMERHEDWACVVALVGGGQEINSGEAGLEEWGRALANSKKHWSVYASPEVMEGGTSTAGRRLFDVASSRTTVNTSHLLHLRTSNRSLRADNLAGWVNHVLEGEIEEAAAMRISDRFPVSLTRDLMTARRVLREQALGESRYGLVGSSKAARLRADGLEPDSNFHGSYPWHHWYLAPREDVRSSFACEVFASEFSIQGLELDWIGLCWGGDLIWSSAEWTARKFWQAGVPKWTRIKNPMERQFRRNSYRVLLTRARQGMVIFVPKGDSLDPTRDPAEFDRTAEFLLSCGVSSLDSVGSMTANVTAADLTLALLL